MKYLLIFVTFLSFAGISYAVDYDSVCHIISDRSVPFDERYAVLAQYLEYLPAEQRFALLKQLAQESKNLPGKEQTIRYIEKAVEISPDDPYIKIY